MPRAKGVKVPRSAGRGFENRVGIQLKAVCESLAKLCSDPKDTVYVVSAGYD